MNFAKSSLLDKVRLEETIIDRIVDEIEERLPGNLCRHMRGAREHLDQAFREMYAVINRASED